MNFAVVHYGGHVVGARRIYARFTKNKPIVTISDVVYANRQRQQKRRSASGFGEYHPAVGHKK